MSDTPTDLAIIGEPTALIVRTDQPIKDRVDIHFEATFPGSPGESVKWEEVKVFAGGVSPEPVPNKHTYLMTWKAEWKGTPEQLDKGPLLRFTVHGVGTAGGKVVGTSSDVLALRRPIEITSKNELIRIMLHEFSSPSGGGNFQFNKEPLKRFLQSLTMQQKKLLLDHPVAGSGHRLVVFITLYPPTQARLMGADFTDEPSPAIPNASFSVFHCQGPGKVVTLVCHTEHFLVNLHNPDTQKFVKDPQANVPAEQWQSKSTNAPVRFKIAALAPDEKFMRGVVLHRVFTAKGNDVMRGNTIHGMINTKGCWMLFRNFNWPKLKYRELDKIYRETFRPMRERPNWPVLRKKLAEVGYDAEPGTTTLSSSLEKFLNYDRNYAYDWFNHDLVGIKYLSNAFDGWGYFASTQKAEGDVHFDNDYKTHGETFEKQFPYSEDGKKPSNNLPEEGSNAYYDPFVRKKVDSKFIVDDTLWRPNVLGFQTTTKFAPITGASNQRFGHLDEPKIQACSWADLYVYRDDKTPPGGL